MLNYIHADLKRITNKKSFYIFGFINILLFEALVFIMSSNNFTSEKYLTIIAMVLDLMPLIIGIYIFSIVYLDDLHSKSIQTAIGFGFKRSEVILVKFINTILISSIISILMFGAIIITGLLYNLQMSSASYINISKILTMGILQILLYSSLASLVVYGVQKASTSITAFILFVTHTFFLLGSMVLNQSFIIDLVGDVTKYLPSALLSSLNLSFLSGQRPETYLVLMILFYFIASFIGSTLLFKHKELEF